MLNTASTAPADISLVISTRDVARLLGCSVPTFRKRLPRLLRQGFPDRSDLLNGWHRQDIIDWVDRHFGRSGGSGVDPYSIESTRKVIKNVRI